ncbi:Ff.00g021070.m01.CDS01 [Fusarium sp. VM40]|nr:Ff.00g021070.m01.CDS01 [Fusarium sp. VM40]
MTDQLTFVTLDVFTTTPFKGNPLAVVHLPPGLSISQTQKQTIAREFNLSETVFIHDVDSNDQGRSSRHIDIFMTDRELPFAGHPTVGTAAYLRLQGVSELITKAGSVPIRFNPDEGLVSVSVPHDTYLNSKSLINIEPTLNTDRLHPNPEIRLAELKAPLFSIVKGVTFSLIRLASLDHLSQISSGAFPCESEDVMDAVRSETYIGRYYYSLMETSISSGGVRTVELRTRMVEAKMEDPATGSAASALTSYLALKEYSETDIRFNITQGVEMGRKSEIVVEVKVNIGKNGERSVNEVQLGGKAKQITKGTIIIPLV